MNSNGIPRTILILYFLFLVRTSFGQQFNHPLFIPPLLKGPDYSLSMGVTRHDFGDQYAGIRTFSYNDQEFLGPTILWYYGDTVQMHVTNHTYQESTNHWHGAHVPPIDDGGPNQPIPADSTWSPPAWQVKDPPCTMWYHPHLHMQTLPQVNMGLAGMIIIRDPKDPLDAVIPHRYGIDDIPLMYHCHILSHEDGGMMHQFVVVDPKKKYPPCTPTPKKISSKGKKSMSM